MLTAWVTPLRVEMPPDEADPLRCERTAQTASESTSAASAR
jgi:hypothetical protein